MKRVARSRLKRVVSREIAKRLASGGVHEVLVAQAQRRIESKGDSTHRYPELWDHPESFRRGGHPLLDTRQTVYNRLNGTTDVRGKQVRISLRGPVVAAYHQNGFQTSGKHFIPLSLKARRGEPDLQYGKDFIIVNDGVTIPQRMIYNDPPEDVKELAREIYRRMR